MKRRDFLTLTAAAISWSPAARAQGSRPEIGYLSGFSADAAPRERITFLEGLKDSGFVDGRNVHVEYRWSDGHYNQLPSLAAELVGRDVAVIVCSDVSSAFAAKASTRTIPIVFIVGADPIKLGLVDSFSRPGGNLTGVTSLLRVLGPKRVELLRELVPAANTIFLLVNPMNPNQRADAPETQAAAADLGLHSQLLMASTETDLETAFATMVPRRAGALVVMPDAFFVTRRAQLVALAARCALPAIYPMREYVEVGGLMSYGSPVADRFYQLGTLTGKVLGGARPADLPVQRTSTFELLINLKTARVLDLTVPSSLLSLADEVIE
jgi:putative ABC transport system substrate-binding protein